MPCGGALATSVPAVAPVHPVTTDSNPLLVTSTADADASAGRQVATSIINIIIKFISGAFG